MTVLRREDVQSRVASWDRCPYRMTSSPILAIVPLIIRRLRGPSSVRITLFFCSRSRPSMHRCRRRLQRGPQKARQLAGNRDRDLRWWFVFGGKLTTYRKLSEHAVDKITGQTKNRGWTAKAPLPGGDIEKGDMAAFEAKQKKLYPFLPEDVFRRYVYSYGTRMNLMLDGVQTLREMGRDFGGGLYEAEILYLINHEFAKSAEDILWRRTKLGLHLEKKSMLALESAMPDYLKEMKAAS